MKTIRFKVVAIILCMVWLSLSVHAQRIQQQLGRGVVAVSNLTDNNVLVSWRQLTQDPEDVTYNLYQRVIGTTNYVKVNNQPIRKTNYKTNLSIIPYYSELSVTLVDSKGNESDKSNPFQFIKHDWKDVICRIDFEKKILDPNLYKAKYAWPADLDGDGEYEWIVDRLSTKDIAEQSHKLQAYKNDGTCLWTVDLGPNVNIDAGQNDMVTAYDINCDGKAEVIIRSSDGTRFWDTAKNNWGKYVMGNDNADTDADGIVDYYHQNVRNAPFYISVINGMTGEEMTSAELNYQTAKDNEDAYSRTNKANYMNEDYAFMVGHCGIAYFDGVHPSFTIECQTRTNDKNHHTYVFEFAYDWNKGTPSNWHHKSTKALNTEPGTAQFHQIRICDVDGNGRDEMVQGGYSYNPLDGIVTRPYVGHGDRFRLSDINPERPGLEMFAIQQSALLGQLLYDAATGEHIKEWYLGSVVDVGRGECMDVDSTRQGYEIYSTMPNLYDCKGNIIKEGETSYPYEGVWWDGDLLRESLASPGGSGWQTNAIVSKYDGTRLIQMSKESGWQVSAGTAVRPLFFGDIIGDWREEIALMIQNNETSTGMVVYSTDIETPYSMYCLQENPHYRLDCTTRGYYQSANTDFYLGHGMPKAPIPPVIVADMRYKNGNWNNNTMAFTSFNQATPVTYSDKKSVIFDISGDNSSTITIEKEVSPQAVYLMNPKGKDYAFTGAAITGNGNLYKSMGGNVIMNNPINSQGKIIISEGTLTVNNTVNSRIELKAKGTLAGNCILNDSILFEGCLNDEGCRLMPGTIQNQYGTMQFNTNLYLPGNVIINEDIDFSNTSNTDHISVKGNLTLKGVNTFIINTNGTMPKEGKYTLVEYGGNIDADIKKIQIKGLEGINYSLVTENNKLILDIKSSRTAAKNVIWKGVSSNVWDYKTNNFSLNNNPTTFVAQDQVVFNDESSTRIINIADKMITNDIQLVHNIGNYTFNGTGAISGTASLYINGKGGVIINNTNNDFTGDLVINNGRLTVKGLEDKGLASCIGAGNRITLGKAELKIDNANTSTDRAIILNDTATVNVLNGYTSFKSSVSGKGVLIKSGKGQLNLNYAGANNYTATILKEGTLSQGAWNATIGMSGSNLDMEGGRLIIFANENTSTVPNINNKITVKENTINYIDASRRCRISGSFSGSGILNLSIPYVRTDIDADWRNFEGVLKVTGNQLRFTTSIDMSKATLQLENQINMGHFKSGTSSVQELVSKIGALSSNSADVNISNGTYNIGYNNQNSSYNGKLSCTKINKYGTGIFTVTANGNTTPLDIYNGTLRINSSKNFTQGNIIVRNSGCVDGTGSTQNITVMQGGTIAAGYDNIAGTLTINGNLTMAKGSSMRVKVKKVLINDNYSIKGNATFNEDTLWIDNMGRNYQAGDELTIFKGSASMSGKIIIRPEIPADGLVWDDSELLTSGILKIAVNTNINNVESIQSVDVYNTQGILIRSGVDSQKALDKLPRGIYIIDGKKIRK